MATRGAPRSSPYGPRAWSRREEARARKPICSEHLLLCSDPDMARYRQL